MHMENDEDTPDGIDLDCDVDKERDGDNEEAEDEEEQEVKKEDEKEQEEEVVDEDEKESTDENDGKEPRTIGEGEVVNTSVDDVDTIVYDQPILLPDQRPEMRKAYLMDTSSYACPMTTNPGASPTTKNSGDSSPQLTAAFGTCVATKTLPGGANSARS
jgi:hypothetical protein